MPPRRNPSPAEKPCYVYLIECQGGSIYVGMAQDVSVRYARHCAGKGAFYTKLNRPVRLLAYREFSSRAAAMHEEKRVKKLRFCEKLVWCQQAWRSGSANPFEEIDAEKATEAS